MGRTMRPVSLFFLAFAPFLFLTGGVQGQSYFEGKWRHNDTDEDRFGGAGPVSLIDTQNGDFVGRYDMHNRQCANGADRDFHISGHIYGTLGNAVGDTVSVDGTLTRCTNPELWNRCKKEHPNETYKVPFKGALVRLGPLKTITMIIVFEDEDWNIPQCKRKSPRTVIVQYELVVPGQPPQASSNQTFNDCLAAAFDKLKTLDPVPLIDRCRN